jgi:hypothetical protein
MAATKCFYLREFFVERLRTNRHRIGIIDNPSVRGVFFHRLRNCAELRNRPHGAHKTSRSGGIAYSLINSVFFGQVHINRHFFKIAGKYGYKNKVAAA